LHITDTNRSIDVEYVIQTVTTKLVGGRYKDYFQYEIKAGSTLFGIIEFYQKLLSTQDKVELNTDAVVETYEIADEIVECSDVNNEALDGGFQSSKNTETVTTADSNTTYVKTSGTWQYEPSVGQVLATRFDLADYG
jgi:hypothetical protein